MLAQIKLWLAPPVFENDEEKTRIARLLNTILLVYLGVVLMISFSLPLSDTSLMVSTLPILTMAMLTVGPLFLMRLGHVRLAAGIFISAMWVFSAGMTFLCGGVTSPMPTGYILIIIMAALLLGGKAAFAFSGLNVAASIVAFSLESSGSLPPTLIPAGPMFAVFTVIGNMVPATVFVYLATHSLKGALARARGNERELIASNLVLEENRKSLEERNERLQDTVGQYVEYMAQVGQGNLSDRLRIGGNGSNGNNASNGNTADDPLVALGQRLDETVVSLHSMTTQVYETANNLNSAAAEILAASSQQASGASEQSAAISQTTTTVDEVKVIAEQSVARAQQVANTSQRTVDVSRAGKQAVQDTIRSMAKIKTRVEGIAENILALSEQTQQIGEIITTVNDIAAQSNMLALNASVEAARAGEYGKGFAVVAVEVRNLAEQSRQATAQVKAILSDIQRATNATVMATEEGTKGVDEGVGLAAQTQQVIEQLSAVIEESAQAATQVVAGGRQQATGIEQIGLAMQNINYATVQNLSSTRQTEQAARELNELAGRLTKVVAQYQL